MTYTRVGVLEQFVVVRRSSFVVRRSSFVVRRSPFVVRRSSSLFAVRRRCLTSLLVVGVVGTADVVELLLLVGGALDLMSLRSELCCWSLLRVELFLLELLLVGWSVRSLSLSVGWLAGCLVGCLVGW